MKYDRFIENNLETKMKKDDLFTYKDRKGKELHEIICF